MKNVLSKLPNEKAQKELKQFLMIGYICGAVSLLMFGFLSMVGIGAAARCIVLVNHQGSKTNPKLKQLRVASFALLAISVLSFIGYTA